jgi:hypothetical protein
MHQVAEYQAGGEQYTDSYFERLEELLGLRAKHADTIAAAATRAIATASAC